MPRTIRPHYVCLDSWQCDWSERRLQVVIGILFSGSISFSSAQCLVITIPLSSQFTENDAWANNLVTTHWHSACYHIIHMASSITLFSLSLRTLTSGVSSVTESDRKATLATLLRLHWDSSVCLNVRPTVRTHTPFGYLGSSLVSAHWPHSRPPKLICELL